MTKQLYEHRRVTPWVAAVATAAMAMALPGCEVADWDDPEHVAEMLGDEAGYAQQTRAVAELRNVPEEGRDLVAGPAAELYLEDEHLRLDIMRRLAEWEHPDAKEAYAEEMAEDHTGRGDVAARIVGKLAAEDDEYAQEQLPVMIEVLEETTDHDRKIGILRGLVHRPDPEALEPTLEILNLDVDNYPIDLHRSACDYIGELALEEPDVIDQRVRDDVLYARMLMSEATGGTTEEACGLAVQRLGMEMVDPHLMGLFHQDNEAVNELLMTYDNPSGGEHFPPNMAKVTAVEHLAMLRAPDAVELFVEELQQEVEYPEVLLDASRTIWAVRESQAINEMMLGLGAIGNQTARDEVGEEVREVLQAAVAGEFYEDDWELLFAEAGAGVQIQMAQDAARSLARLGDREARDTLLEVAEELPDELMDYEERVGNHIQQLLGLEDGLGELDEEQLQEDLDGAMEHLADLRDAEERGEELEEQFEELDEDDDDYEEVQQQLQEVAEELEELGSWEPPNLWVPTRDLFQELRPQWIAAKSFVYLATAEDRERFEALLEELQELEFDEEFEQLAEMIDEFDFDEQIEDFEHEEIEEFTDAVSSFGTDVQGYVDSMQEQHQELVDKLESFLMAFEMMEECHPIEDHQRRADCYAENYLYDEHAEEVDDEVSYAAQKAAFEISRLSAEDAGPIVADALDTSDLDLRETLVFAGYRVPSAHIAERATEIIEEEADERGDDYRISHHELRMLHAWLQHQDLDWDELEEDDD